MTTERVVVPRLEEQAARQENAVLSRPQDGDAWGSLGLTYRLMGYDELALEVLLRSAELGTGYSDVWYYLSFLLHDEGRQVDALEAARKAVALAPESARCLVNLGTRLLDDAKAHEAIAYLEKATRLLPDRAEPIGVLGIAHFRAQNFAAAAECLETSLRKDPEADPSAWAYLGVSLDETGRFEGAVCALETALFAKPDYGWAWGRLGKALRALGRHAEAIHAYERAITHDFAPSILWWDMGLSAVEVEDAVRLERACRGLRGLDRGLATKLRRRLRSLKQKQAAAALPSEAPEVDGARASDTASLATRI